MVAPVFIASDSLFLNSPSYWRISTAGQLLCKEVVVFSMPGFLEELIFQRNLCYHASQETIWLQKEAPFGVKLGERGPPNHF
jgi:hypothetical protein